jgi:hypothetical protein
MKYVKPLFSLQLVFHFITNKAHIEVVITLSHTKSNEFIHGTIFDIKCATCFLGYTMEKTSKAWFITFVVETVDICYIE